MMRHWRPPRSIGLVPTGLFALVVLLTYVATAILARQLVGAGPLATIWPPAAVAFCALLMGGWWMVPVLVVADMLAMRLTGLPLLLLAHVGGIAGPVMGVVLYRRLISRAPVPQRLGETARLIFLVLPAIAMITTVFGVMALRMGEMLERFPTTLVTAAWLLGDLLGLIVFTPLLMALSTRWCGLGGSFDTRRRGHRWEPVVVSGLALGALLATWHRPTLGQLGWLAGSPALEVVPLLLLMFVLMLWSALRLSSLTTFIIVPLLVLAGLRMGVSSIAPLASDAVIAQWLLLLPTLLVMSATALVIEAGDRDREQYERRLRYQSRHDPLTGLLNRTAFAEQARARLQADNGSSWLLGYMDLDQFQSINDTLGHGSGDEMLTELAGVLQKTLNSGDCLARLGGDEFGLIVQGAWGGDGEARIRRIQSRIGEFRFVRASQHFSVRATVGVTPLAGDPEDYERLLGTADLACIAAKESGGNRILFTSGPDRIYRRLTEMKRIPLIQQAIDADRISLCEQPLVSLSNPGQKQMVEVLCRLRNDDGVLLMPEAFIPVAERFGLMPAIDRLVVRKTLSWLATTPDPPQRCFINLSAASVNDPEFTEFLFAALAAPGADPARLGFELTETVAISHYATASKLIDRLRALGCLVALDDFGTGMSSFGHLQQLNVDMVKIDGQFVRDLTVRPINEAIVRSLAQVARSTGILIVAEWVESAEIAASLDEIGIDYAQGYHFGRPVGIR
ncbi:MAG: EAL domain-containing protein [Pseudomonadota bacterium]|nr:MAG: EAL domain-containing protein [Pseudomonadota bacterium]